MQKRIKVCLNTTGLLSDFTGIGRYTFELSKALINSNNVKPTFFYGGFCSNELISEPPRLTRSILPFARKYIPHSYRLRRMVQQYRFQKNACVEKAEIYHEPSFIALNSNKPTVVTVHDLSWIHNPDWHPIERVRHMDKNFEKSISKADHLITDSEFVRTELIDLFSIRPDKVTSIHLAAGDEFFAASQSALQAILSKYRLAYRRYFLVVGTLEPRKNILTALRAYMRLSRTDREYFKLVHIGGKGWLSGSDRDLVDQALNDRSLLSLGFVPQEDLSKIYAGAYAFLYPSIYEGFGLPILEAMKSGVPVIASQTSSIPEVVGAAGILCSAFDEDAFSEGISDLLNDPTKRDELARKSVDRARVFSWQKTANRTISIYQKLLK